jgi:hypothetical protein
MAATKKTGSFAGKSNKLGHGGRAAQLKAKGVPGGVIGEIARSKGAAPGQKNYHGANAARGGMAHDGSLKGSNMHSDRPMRHEKY